MRFARTVIGALTLAQAAVAASYGAIPLQAEIDFTPGIIGEDNRQPVDSIDPPWNAIGHVNIRGYRVKRACSGTLIAPRLVLTAADCIIDPWKKLPFPSDRIIFSAGVLRDSVLGRSWTECVKFPQGFRYIGPERINPDLPYYNVPLEHYTLGLAVIVLTDDIPQAGVFPVEQTDVIREGLPLTHASYSLSRRYLLTAHRGCKALRRLEGLWLTDCDTDAFSYGGPVITTAEEGMQVAAVMVGAIANSATVAVPLAEWPDLALNADCP